MKHVTIKTFNYTQHSYGFAASFGLHALDDKHETSGFVRIELWKGMSAKDAAESLRRLANAIEQDFPAFGCVNMDICESKTPEIFCRKPDHE